jgi:hypothetical protein
MSCIGNQWCARIYVVPENTSSTAIIGNAESLLRQLAIRVQMAKDVKES